MFFCSYTSPQAAHSVIITICTIYFPLKTTYVNIRAGFVSLVHTCMENCQVQKAESFFVQIVSEFSHNFVLFKPFYLKKVVMLTSFIERKKVEVEKDAHISQSKV